jgi:putative tryptophan/tyrosine transport system substrate-binding protein
MKRREFISLLGGAAAAWPLAVRAQQPAMPVIGLLSARGSDESAHLGVAFRRGLAESGAIDGQSVTIDYRWADGHYDRLPALAAQLAGRPVAVLAAVGGEPATRAAVGATKTIPVVAIFGGDPVASGLVASLNRPGGNVTGISILTVTMEPKRLGLLRDIVPQATSFGVLLNPTFSTAGDQLKLVEEAARSLGLSLQPFRASTDGELEAAFESMAQKRIPALSVAGDSFFSSRREKLAALAARHAVPAIYNFRHYAVAGGLMSYGIDLPDVYRQAGVYTGRILKGAKAADLPVLQPIKFEFVINLKAARALGVKISDNVLSLADEVIE